jgi:uncharacterized protein (TIGR03435 family)
MMCVTKTLLTGALLISACCAQSTVRLEFDAASVKASSPPFDHFFCSGGPGSGDPGLFRCENFSLSNLVNLAYELGANRLSAPGWMNETSFDINAKVPKGTTPEQLRLMLQNLLADRFKLAAHHQTRESPEYRLVLAKGGPKLKLAKQQSDAGGDGPPDPDAPKPFRVDEAGYPTFAPDESGTKSMFNGRAHMHEPRMTMGWLAAILSGSLHATVIDATGLDGEYEIDLYWVLDAAPAATSANDESGPTIVQALQKELGLRLEKSANGTKDVLVVDHAERVPTGN